MTREEKLRRVVTRMTRKDVSDIELDDDLVEKLGLDSLAGLALLAAIEKHPDLAAAVRRARPAQAGEDPLAK